MCCFVLHISFTRYYILNLHLSDIYIKKHKPEQLYGNHKKKNKQSLVLLATSQPCQYTCVQYRHLFSTWNIGSKQAQNDVPSSLFKTVDSKVKAKKPRHLFSLNRIRVYESNNSACHAHRVNILESRFVPTVQIGIVYCINCWWIMISVKPTSLSL